MGIYKGDFERDLEGGWKLRELINIGGCLDHFGEEKNRDIKNRDIKKELGFEGQLFFSFLSFLLGFFF